MGSNFMKGGTPVGSASLCKTCSNAHIMTGYRESEMMTICNEVQPNIVVPFVIYECSGYYDKNRPSWKEMKNLAIDIVPTTLKPAGFKTGAGFAEAAYRSVKLRVGPQDEEDEDD